MNYPAALKKIILSEITNAEKEQLVSFISGVCKAVSAEYIEVRLRLYDYVIAYHANEKLCAVQFVNRFLNDGINYFYLGPLFSTDTAFFPLFVNWLNEEWVADNDGAIYLAAEFQNPELFLFFKILFREHSFPSFENSVIPEKTKATALKFSKHIAHIMQLDVMNLSTVSHDTLYTLKKRDEPIINWMKSRGVDLQKNQTQLLIVCLQNSEKYTVLKELSIRLNKTASRSAVRKQIMDQLENTKENV